MVEPVRLHVQHKAEQRFVPLPASHRHRVVAVLIDEVGGAVDGVDVPHGSGRGGAHCGVFLAHDGVGGKLAQDALAQKLLRPAVPDGDQVLVAGLAAHRVRLQPGLPQRGAGLAHQRLGQFKPFHISPPFSSLLLYHQTTEPGGLSSPASPDHLETGVFQRANRAVVPDVAGHHVRQLHAAPPEHRAVPQHFVAAGAGGPVVAGAKAQRPRPQR